MKIIKESLKKLVEAEEKKEPTEKKPEETLADVDPKTDSVEKVADAIRTTVEDETKGEATLSDTKAKKVATEVKEVAQELNTDKTAIVPNKEETDEFETKNNITEALDDCLNAAKTNMGINQPANSNLLLIGLPGAAKTAIVKDWAKNKGLILVSLNATDPKIETMVNGMPVRDHSAPKESPNRVIWAYAEDKLGPLMDPKNKEKCVLFVDEFNRQQRLDLRRTFLSLFNEKTNADGKLNFTKTLLFTVVCINPAVKSDPGATNLIGAELDRFDNQLDIYSTSETASDFFQKWKRKKLFEFGIIPEGSKLAKRLGKWGPTRELTPEENEKINIILKEADLALNIVENPAFQFDGEDLNDDEGGMYGDRMLAMLDLLHKKHLTLLSQRTLTNMVFNSQGDPKKLLAKVNAKKFMKETKDMLINCINSYVQDLNGLRKDVGLDGGTTVVATDNQEKKDTTQDNVTKEDDAALFSQQATGKTAKSEANVAQELQDFKLNF